MIIDIFKNDIPYRFEIVLGELFEFEVNYNTQYDYFTLDLLKDGEVVIQGEKILYGKELFSNYPHIDAPRGITPKDLAGIENRVTFNNLGEMVFLVVNYNG